jgi:putative DNA primase/helicase
VTETSYRQLAPLGWWESNFPGRNKNAAWDLEAASEHLQSSSYATERIYSPDIVRARGAWEHEGKLLLHLGNRLLQDGTEIRINDFQDQSGLFCYEAGQRIEVGLPCTPLTTDQGHRLVELAGQFLWTNDLCARLLLGWCVTAPLCGTLQWRPHVWLTGPTGCGKGSILRLFVKPLMPFRFPKDFSGDSTEAGIRQFVKIDALPILYDEAESKDDISRTRIQKLLTLLRASSSANEKMAKGTTTGKPLQFELRSSFLLASINVLVDEGADRRRIGVLELRKSEKTEQWDALQKDLEFVTADIGHALFARTISLFSVLRENIKVFGAQIGKYLGDTAVGDQYGPLLAGAYLLEHDEQVEPVDAWEIVKGYNWREFGKPHKSERDERRCLDVILGVLVPVQVEHHAEKITIGELIRVAAGRDIVPGTSQHEANKILVRYGVKVDDLDDSVYIANHAAELEKLLPKGPWQSWAQHLKRLKDATTPEGTAWLAGSSQRYTRLPWIV